MEKHCQVMILKSNINLKYSIAVVFLLLFFSCSNTKKGKTREELIKEELAQLEDVSNFLKVLPYKYSKLLVKASTGGGEFLKDHPELDEIISNSNEVVIDSNGNLQFNYKKVVEDFAIVKDELKNFDEDDFPSFSEIIFKSRGKVLEGDEREFARNCEHGVLSFLAMYSGSLTDEVALYEMHHMKADKLSNPEIKAFVSLLKGVLLQNNEFYYLAERELIDNDKQIKNSSEDFHIVNDFLSLETTKYNEKELMLALNSFSLGLSHYQMENQEDKDLAIKDFEQVLLHTEKAGFNYGFVYLTEAYLSVKKNDDKEFKKAMDKLVSMNCFSKENVELLNKLKKKGVKDANEDFIKELFPKLIKEYTEELFNNIDFYQILKKLDIPYLESFKAAGDRLEKTNASMKKYTSTEFIEEAYTDAKNSVEQKSKEMFDKAKGLFD